MSQVKVFVTDRWTDGLPPLAGKAGTKMIQSIHLRNKTKYYTEDNKAER